MFVRDMAEKLLVSVDISEKIQPHAWEKLPWRWVAERALSWFNHLSKGYESVLSSALAMVQIPHLHTLLKRL